MSYISRNLEKVVLEVTKEYPVVLVCYLTKWSSAETLESGAMNGAILENYVVAEIMKTYWNSGKEPFIYVTFKRCSDLYEARVIGN